jgi:hypothetical protein
MKLDGIVRVSLFEDCLPIYKEIAEECSKAEATSIRASIRCSTKRGCTDSFFAAP